VRVAWAGVVNRGLAFLRSLLFQLFRAKASGVKKPQK
jgi:hypothetical protein